MGSILGGLGWGQGGTSVSSDVLYLPFRVVHQVRGSTAIGRDGEAPEGWPCYAEAGPRLAEPLFLGFRPSNLTDSALPTEFNGCGSAKAPD